MSDEDAFIRALRERPDDETTRLVYTDWLDDRSDPRAEYLRTEAAWATLQPSDEQYRPLYRRVSRLAAGLEPEWFATVSRVGNLVRRAWEPSRPKLGPARPVPNQPQTWGEAVASLRTLLGGVFGSERLFCPPVDFAAFMCVIGDANWNLNASELVALANEFVIEALHLTESDTAEREMWMLFAHASADSWHCVSCDLESPIFGVVAESMGNVWRPGGDTNAHFCGRNVLHFLTRYLPLYETREGYEHWPHVPRAEWATH